MWGPAGRNLQKHSWLRPRSATTTGASYPKAASTPHTVSYSNAELSKETTVTKLFFKNLILTFTECRSNMYQTLDSSKFIWTSTMNWSAGISRHFTRIKFSQNVKVNWSLCILMHIKLWFLSPIPFDFKQQLYYTVQYCTILLLHASQPQVNYGIKSC